MNGNKRLQFANCIKIKINLIFYDRVRLALVFHSTKIYIYVEWIALHCIAFHIYKPLCNAAVGFLVVMLLSHSWNVLENGLLSYRGRYTKCKWIVCVCIIVRLFLLYFIPSLTKNKTIILMTSFKCLASEKWISATFYWNCLMYIENTNTFRVCFIC